MADTVIAEAYNGTVGVANGAATELHVENGAALKQHHAVPVTFKAVKPHLLIQTPKAADAIAFYKKAFGAEEVEKMFAPKRKADQDHLLILHAHLRFGETDIFIADEPEEVAATVKSPTIVHGNSMILHVATSDVDAAAARAIEAGATVKIEVADQFWGDRYGVVVDPFGYAWGLSTTLPKDAEVPPDATVEGGQAT